MTPPAIAGSQSADRLQNLVNSLIAGEAWAAFIGAGPSRTAGLPDWSELVRRVAELAGIEIPSDIKPDVMPLALERCLANLGADAFWDFVRQQLCVMPEAPRVYEIMARLPFDVFVTTNLDSIFAGVHATTSSQEPAIVCFPDVQNRQLGGRRLFHLHGSCESFAAREPGGDPAVVITQAQYRNAYGPIGSRLPGVVETLFSELKVLLIGASLGDPPVKHLIQVARDRVEVLGRIGPLPAWQHYALVPSVDAEPNDLAWEAMGIGIEPVFYHNPVGADYRGLAEVLEWIEDSVSPPAQARLPETGIV